MEGVSKDEKSENGVIRTCTSLHSTERVLCSLFFSPAGIDQGYLIISGFGRHLGMTDTLGLDLMLVSISMPDKMNYKYPQAAL